MNAKYVSFYVSYRLAFPEENNRSLKKIPKLEDPAQYSMIGLKVQTIALLELFLQL